MFGIIVYITIKASKALKKLIEKERLNQSKSDINVNE